MRVSKAALLVPCMFALAPAQGFDLQCEQDLGNVTPVALPTTEFERFELADATRCRWHAGDEEATSSVLFSVPSATASQEVEISSRLDAAGTTATHVALLDADFKPLKWIPHRSFRERKKYLRVRFFVNPADAVKYILVGGASNAADDTLARIYTPATTTVLDFVGVVTARELEADFLFVTTGEIRIGVRKPRIKTVVVAP